jgi:hypothetical protein
MRKKITCKVVRTIPLNININDFRSTNRSNVKSRYINSDRSISKTNKYTQETTTNHRAKDSSNSVIYTDRLNITRIPIDNGYTAQTLNFYA